MKIEYVAVSDLTNADLYWIAAGCDQTKWRTITGQQVIADAINKRVNIHRVSGSAEGIFIISFEENNLIVELMAGRHFLRNFMEIRRLLLQMAKDLGCSGLAGYVERPGLKKLYERLTPAKATVTLYVEALS